MGGTIESKNGGIFEKVVFYPLSVRTLKTHFWISSYTKLNILFEHPPEYPPIKIPILGTKKGDHQTSHDKYQSNTVEFMFKTRSKSFLRTIPEPPEISVDCLIIALLVHTEPLPDNPAWKDQPALNERIAFNTPQRRLNSSRYAFKCPLTKDFMRKE